ncbi:MAG: pilus assembly protein CpaE, partial [Sphingomonadaceae bacterium]|nr:pilus assembly protein CpaE [Sphingomonadaceae bacterium]
DLCILADVKAASQAAKLGQPFAKVATSAKLAQPLAQLVTLTTSAVESEEAAGGDEVTASASLLDKLNLKGLLPKKAKPAPTGA